MKLRVRALSACVFAFVLVASTSCSASYPTVPSNSAPVSFQVHYTRVQGFASVGGTYSFVAYALTSDGAYEDVTLKSTWVTSDPLVLRPASTGAAAFTAVATGGADVLARYQGFASSISMFVIRPDRQPYPLLSVAPGAPLMGRTSQAVLRLQQSASVSQVVTDLATWASSDARVVTVERGLVTGIAPGTAQITASYNGLTAWYGLSVPPGR